MVITTPNTDLILKRKIETLGVVYISKTRLLIMTEILRRIFSMNLKISIIRTTRR